MADDKSAGIYNLTTPAVMTHPNLLVARAFGAKGKESGKPKFSANLLLSADPKHPDLDAMKALAVKVARAKWPNRDFKATPFKWPFSSGDAYAEKKKAQGKPPADYARGHILVAARSQYEPGLAGIENGRAVDYEGEAARKQAERKFFFGAEVLAQLNFVAYEGVGANPDGVTAYLNKVFATGKGTKIAGAGSSTADTFSGYVGKMSAEDPTGGTSTLDDDISF